MSVVIIVASAEFDRECSATISQPRQAHVVIAAVEQSPLQWLANDEGDARARAEASATDHEAAPTDTSSVDVKPDLPEQLVRDALTEHGPRPHHRRVREGDDARWLKKAGSPRSR